MQDMFSFDKTTFEPMCIMTNYFFPFINQIVDQESLESVEVIQRPVVFCIAAWFGNVRLIDNIEINV